MQVGAFTVDVALDGETRREIPILYPDVPADELADALEFTTPGTDVMVMTIGCHVIRGEGRTILIDAGVGTGGKLPFRGGDLPASLAVLGVAPEDVTDVVYTHLHADHIGWATRNGQLYFPKATHRCDRRDWDHFVSPDYEIPAWEHASTTSEEDAARVRLAPLEGRVEFWEGDAEILPGLRSIDAAGHTPGTDLLVLSSGGDTVAFLGDIVHSQPELTHAWRFAVHGDPTAAVASLRATRDFLVDEDVTFAAAHFTGMPWGRLERQGDSYRWVEVIPS